MLLILSVVSLLPFYGVLADNLYYPEDRSDLQQYQDTSRCYPDVGEWYQMYRNYYSDPIFGGTAKCVKYTMYGRYENFSSPAIYTFAGNGKITGHLNLDSSDCYVAKDTFGFIPDDPKLTPREASVIYTDCVTCSVLRHRYAGDGLQSAREFFRRRTTTSNGLAKEVDEFVFANIPTRDFFLMVGKPDFGRALKKDPHSPPKCYGENASQKYAYYRFNKQAYKMEHSLHESFDIIFFLIEFRVIRGAK
ncbi:uncharacterized protein LOC119180117 [Rhipicephalus microplus]|uniref:uncharacterized protein LOC119180117 n=1 Tax=Rhipicephalus microplus TaxID=6941 RepID=UPI003F6B7671